ncbi:serine/threonine-protein kinase [Paraburkholderia phytofirmans]
MVPSPGSTVYGSGGVAYTLGPPIKEGGFAMVYEAIDEFGNPVALKVLKPSADAVGLHQQWTHEHTLFLKLRHPNVVTIYDAFGANFLLFLALERAHGTIGDEVRQRGPMPEWRAREVARQLLFGLNFVHSHGVLHKDITINNVLVFNNPLTTTFKISDFGISRDLFTPWAMQPPELNNAIFPLPEILLQEFGGSSIRSDLYHLGLVLLFCLTGQLPWHEGTPQEQINAAALNGAPRQQAEALRTPFSAFVAVLLRRHADFRYQSALDAWRALKFIPAS